VLVDFKYKVLLFPSGWAENAGLCMGFSFRLRSSSYDGTRQPNILGHQLNETNTQANNGSGRCCQYRFFKLELSIQLNSGIAQHFARSWILLKVEWIFLQ